MSPRRGRLAVSALLTAFGFPMALGCGPRVDIASGPLAGKMGGQPWTVATAETDLVLASPGQLLVTMSADGFVPCSGRSSGGNQLFLSIPAEPGDYDPSVDLAATFYLKATDENLIASEGRLRIDQITASAVSGGATLAFDRDNTVSGQFQITICP